MKKFLFLLMTATSFAHAIEDYTGQIDHVVADGGIVKIVMKNGSGGVTCGARNMFWIDPSSHIGKATISIALAAKMANSNVWILGDGACSTAWPYSGSEQVLSLDLR